MSDELTKQTWLMIRNLRHTQGHLYRILHHRGPDDELLVSPMDQHHLQQMLDKLRSIRHGIELRMHVHDPSPELSIFGLEDVEPC